MVAAPQYTSWASQKGQQRYVPLPNSIGLPVRLVFWPAGHSSVREGRFRAVSEGSNLVFEEDPLLVKT